MGISHEQGQALVLVAILLVVLILLAAVAVDGARVYLAREYIQNAADAAALAGALELRASGSWESAIKVAQTYAERNGAQVCHVEGSQLEIAVTVSRIEKAYFSGFLGLNEFTVSARAVAEVKPYAAITPTLAFYPTLVLTPTPSPTPKVCLVE